MERKSVAVFTPTYRPGGLDVLEASLMRQTFGDFYWIVADEIRESRKTVWMHLQGRVDFPIKFIDVEKKEKNKRNLAAAYNQAVSDLGAEILFVSLQDYMWLPPEGIQRFVDLHEKFPTDIYTGVTHISRDPYPNKINKESKNFGYSIFDEPYYDKPKRMSWLDVRVTEIYNSDSEYIINAEPGHWEANWAAIPVSLIQGGLRWDEEYDLGIAYENMDFAQRANKNYRARTIIDTKNVAISLPHKDYFEGEREDIEEYSNREVYESKWLK